MFKASPDRNRILFFITINTKSSMQVIKIKEMVALEKLSPEMNAAIISKVISRKIDFRIHTKNQQAL